MIAGAVAIALAFCAVLGYSAVAQADAGPSVQLGPAPTAEHDPPPRNPKPYWTEKHCYYEDQNNCYWNAGTDGIEGSGGHSFITRKVRMKGTKRYVVCIFYVERAYAKKHDRCGKR